MRYREFAGTGIRVSEVGFGVWSVATTWWGVRDIRLARDLLAEALDLGITFFDTADVYGDEALGETLLREVFAGRRDRVVIATKFGYDIYGHPGPRQGHREMPQDWSPAFLRRAVEGSLRRLGTDRIDIYQMHNPRIEAIESDPLRHELERLRAEGKIRAVGAALGPDIGWLDEGLAALGRGRAPDRGPSEAHGGAAPPRPPLDMLQVIYNAIEREPGEDLLRAAAEAGRSCAVRVPHASGLLDGSYDPERHFDRSDHRSHRPRAWMQAGLAVRDALPLRAGEATMGQAAIRFCLDMPAAATVLPNITSRENLREFAAAGDLPPLAPADLEALRDVWRAHREELRQPLSDSRSKPTPRAG